MSGLQGRIERADCEKMALAMLDGWRVLRVTGTHVRFGRAIDWISEALKKIIDK